MIKVYLKGQQTDWDLFLGCLAGAYRSSTHQSTGFTPNMLMLGKEIGLPTEIVFGSLDNTGETISSYGSYVEFIRERMHRAHGIAQKQLTSSAKRQKESYDLREKTLSFKAGDIDWYLNETKREGISPKRQDTYWGPCIILEKLNDCNFRIKYKEDVSSKVVHHNKLKKYNSAEVPISCKQ